MSDSNEAETADPFEAVHPALRPSLVRQGFKALTPVQTKVLASDSEGRNLRISSQTGSGKTVAIGLGLAEQLIEAVKNNEPGPIGVVIAPTRELAAQVQKELETLYSEVRGLGVDVVTGGTDIVRERRALRRRAPLLVGTPGRLLDHVRNKGVDLSNVRNIVLDEADQMLDMGFKDELDALVDAVPEGSLRHLISATFPDAVRRFADRFQPEALHIEGTALGAANEDIEHISYVVHARDRYPSLVNCLLAIEEGRCLIFVSRRVDAADLSEALAEDGFSALPFSGDLSQAQRTRTLNAFKNGIVKTLVATDVAARGIDVSDIRTVIHFDLPVDADTYTHRSGRTGRAGQKGRSLTIVPANKENRVRWLMRGAKVEADWARVPSVKKINKANMKRARKALHERMENVVEQNEGDIEYARELLERHDPELLISCLLQMSQSDLPREPMTVRTFEPRGEHRFEPRKGPGPGREYAPRGRRGGPPRGRRGGGGGGWGGPRSGGGPRGSGGPRGRSY